MITICEDRYGRGWVAWMADPEYAPDGFNCGDGEHDEFYRANHTNCYGWGRTPNDATAALIREIERFRSDMDGYTCCLLIQERDEMTPRVRFRFGCTNNHEWSPPPAPWSASIPDRRCPTCGEPPVWMQT